MQSEQLQRQKEAGQVVGDVIDFPDQEEFHGVIEQHICSECGGDAFRWFRCSEMKSAYVLECGGCNAQFAMIGVLLEEDVLGTLH